MSVVHIPEGPPGYRDDDASAIRAPASAGGLVLPAAAMANWLLAHGASVVAQMYFPSGKGISAMNTRVYHRRSADCDRLVMVPLIRYASGAQPTFKVTISGKSQVDIEFDESTTETTAWGDPCWQRPITVFELSANGFQYHAVEWSNLYVSSIMWFEMPRDLLDTALSDTLVEIDYGAYAGLISDRMITDGSRAGVPDILAGVASAKTATKKHGGGWWAPDDSPWSVAASGIWSNIADTAMSTSGFYFPHRARKVLSNDTVQSYEVRIRARYTGTGTGDFRLSSTYGSDTVSFTSLTSGFAWYAPDSAAALDLAAGTHDKITPEAQTTDSGTDVEVSSIQWIEA